MRAPRGRRPPRHRPGRPGRSLLARRRISDDAVGLAALLALFAEHGDIPEDPVPVAIETPRGLLTACLRATGRPVNLDVAGPLPGPALGRRPQIRPRRLGRAG